jgi:hypothetical protein
MGAAENEAVVFVCLRMRALTMLDLSQSVDFTDWGMRVVAELKALTTLNLGQCLLVSDQGLGLRRYMKHSELGLRAVEELKSLDYLNLGPCYKVTDVGHRPPPLPSSPR